MGIINWFLNLFKPRGGIIHQPVVYMEEITGPEKIISFTKHDTGKPRFDLLVPEVIEGVAQVLAHGAAKYAPGNWQKCDDPMRYYAATQRHLNAYHRGEKLDGESGLHHLFHAICNIMFLWWFDNRRPK
jgi:hypothetical protein